jgi:CDP-glucose 4,6-dehydratase
VAYWSGRRVLVTGAGGFIAGNLTAALVGEGAHVTAVTRDNDPWNSLALLGTAAEVREVRGDLRDPAFCERIIAEHQIADVFHLAAQALVGVASRTPTTTFDSNIRGTWTLLEACRVVGGVQSIVVASSDKAYGIHAALPYTESACLAPTFPYDVSKACADLIARSYAATYQQPVAVTRLANVYGPGDLNFTRLIPDAMRCGFARRPLVLRSDGTMQREYLYIADAVAAYLSLGQRLAENGEGVCGTPLNFGSATPVAVIEVVRAAGRLFPNAPEPVVLGTATSEIPLQSLDSSRAAEVLGWRPRHDLNTGLELTAAWYSTLFTQHPRLLQ